MTNNLNPICFGWKASQKWLHAHLLPVVTSESMVQLKKTQQPENKQTKENTEPLRPEEMTSANFKWQTTGRIQATI